MTSKKTTVKNITIIESADDVPLPQLSNKSKFKTIPEWLNAIAVGEGPQKHIYRYQIGLFEMREGDVLYFVGVNSSDESETSSSTRIDFQPRYMYYRVPKAYINTLDRQQILNKITLELKNFTETDRFNHSFVSKAEVVVFEATGQTIWTKN